MECHSYLRIRTVDGRVSTAKSTHIEWLCEAGYARYKETRSATINGLQLHSIDLLDRKTQYISEKLHIFENVDSSGSSSHRYVLAAHRSSIVCVREHRYPCKNIHANTLFRNIVKSLLSQARFSRLVKEVPDALIGTLKENEQAAGELVCDILVDNSFPEFVTDVAKDLSEEAVEDLQALSNFVINIPKLAPAILANIEEGAEDVVSVIGQLVTDPEAAITVIVGGVESVVESAWDDITSVGGEIVSDIACFFKSCAESTPAEVLALVTACDQIGSGAPVTITTPGGTAAANTAIVSSIAAVPTYVPPTAAATLTGTPPAPT